MFWKEEKELLSQGWLPPLLCYHLLKTVPEQALLLFNHSHFTLASSHRLFLYISLLIEVLDCAKPFLLPALAKLQILWGFRTQILNSSSKVFLFFCVFFSSLRNWF